MDGAVAVTIAWAPTGLSGGWEGVGWPSGDRVARGGQNVSRSDDEAASVLTSQSTSARPLREQGPRHQEAVVTFDSTDAADFALDNLTYRNAT